MIHFHKAVEEIYLKDTRYKVDSYEFILQALRFTQRKLKKQGHLSGKELAGGCAKFAIEQYGPMAKAVLKHWGITKTQDFGNIVNNMIDAKLLSKTESDSIEDFIFFPFPPPAAGQASSRGTFPNERDKNPCPRRPGRNHHSQHPGLCLFSGRKICLCLSSFWRGTDGRADECLCAGG